MGDLSPGDPAFACYGKFSSGIGNSYGTGYIRISEPKGMVSHRAPGFFSNDSSKIYYLKNDCKFKFEWVPSSNGEIVPFAVEPYLPLANGLHDFIARKKISDTEMVFDSAVISIGAIAYVDDDQKLTFSHEYEVLTCKSTHCKFNFKAIFSI